MKEILTYGKRYISITIKNEKVSDLANTIKIIDTCIGQRIKVIR